MTAETFYYIAATCAVTTTIASVWNSGLQTYWFNHYLNDFKKLQKTIKEQGN